MPDPGPFEPTAQVPPANIRLVFRGTRSPEQRALRETRGDSVLYDALGDTSAKTVSIARTISSAFRGSSASSAEQMDWFNELQRKTVSAKTAARLIDLVSNADVTGLLAKIKAPTLVLHCRDDGVAPFDAGRRMAARIPNAQFVALEGRNHLILDNEPAWRRFLVEVRQFLTNEE